MTKRFVGAVTLAAGLTFLPVTVRSSDQAKTPTLAMSDACAEAGMCCFSLGDLCMLGGKIIANYRPAIGSSCGIKPGT
jgi:hypothetical protein